MTVANSGAPLRREYERLWHTFVSEYDEEFMLTWAPAEKEQENAHRGTSTERTREHNHQLSAEKPWGRGLQGGWVRGGGGVHTYNVHQNGEVTPTGHKMS